jgi:uracil-DNA glycosylase
MNITPVQSSPVRRFAVEGDRIPDGPRTLKHAEILAHRRSLVGSPHLAPLTNLVSRLRTQGLDIPDFDPLDGGCGGTVLFVHESPGRRARRKTGSGYISQNNDDQSAANFYRLRQEAGVDRKNITLWNIVPHFCGNTSNDSKITRADVEAGSRHLLDVISKMPNIIAIVLCGRKAQQAIPWVHDAYPHLQLLFMPHCSPTNLNRRPQDREEIKRVLGTVSKLIGQQHICR